MAGLRKLSHYKVGNERSFGRSKCVFQSKASICFSRSIKAFVPSEKPLIYFAFLFSGGLAFQQTPSLLSSFLSLIIHGMEGSQA